ncbi:response regulator transcription factor [Candidatus Terasakiella magnetica]|uniref:response regulator transcription factor n=1 Tax=Candidatus Terasakiella magnetica TaxID=1867952 RepID=UPI0013F4D3FB|nr:response regulator [Candidatus Terasakiella magnetica]
MGRLLIVDDDKSVLNVMKQALINAQFDVESATNGKDAIELLQSSSFDLLITDILMPEIDGLAVIDHAISHHQDIGILAISGGGPDKDGGDLLDAALTCGADAILQKPFRPDELIRTVKALLR